MRGVGMCTGAALEGVILVRHRCLPLVSSLPVLFPWFGVLALAMSLSGGLYGAAVLLLLGTRGVSAGVVAARFRV